MAKTTPLNHWRPPGGALMYKAPDGRKLIPDSEMFLLGSERLSWARPSRARPGQVPFMHHGNREQRPAEPWCHWRRFSETNRGLLAVNGAAALPAHHEISRLGCWENNSCWCVEQPSRFISAPGERRRRWQWGGVGRGGRGGVRSERVWSLLNCLWSPTTWRRQRHAALAEESASGAW